MRFLPQPLLRVPIVALIAGGTTAVVAFGAGVVLAISRNNPVGYDIENPRRVFAERALESEVGSMMFLSMAFGVISGLYLVARRSKWHRKPLVVRVRDAGLVGLLNIAGIMLQSVMAYARGDGNGGPTFGILLHLAAALAMNALVYESRFRQLTSSRLEAEP
jgi:hypothetical protein